MDGVFGEGLDIDSDGLVLPYFEAILGTFACGYKQVLHFLVVDLQHGKSQLVLSLAFWAVLVNALEDLLASERNDSAVGPVADHRVAFAGAGLPVGE